MTNQEAIKTLNSLLVPNDHPKFQEAQKMAISALQAQDLQPNLQPTCNQLETVAKDICVPCKDTISRQAAQTELMMKCERYTLARESHGMGHVEWSSDLISVADAMDAIRDLPSAQPESEKRKAESAQNVPKEDLISRKAAIDALDCINGVEEVLRALPSAQPEREKGEWTKDCACEICGFKPWYERDIHTLSFCPNCGADMREE